MFLNYIFKGIFVVTFFQIIVCELIFEDNFDYLNTSKWQIIDRKAQCERFNPGQISCDTSNEINLRAIDGTLALTGNQETYFDRKYTGATIVSKQSYYFNFNKFNYLIRIRAALPNLTCLVSHIYLLAHFDYQRIFEKLFPIVKRNGYKMWNGNILAEIIKNPIFNGSNLDDFIIYEMQLSNGSFILKLNNQAYHKEFFRFEYDFESSKFGPFNLVIALNIENDIEEYLKSLICPSMLIDYVKIYQIDNSKFNFEDENIVQKNPNILNICKTIQLLKSSAKIAPGLINKPLNLLWSDEFENNTIDQDKWLIKTNQMECSNENEDQENNCKNLHNPNIKVSNGTLKLYPMDGKYQEINPDIKDSYIAYSGIVIASVSCFKNVRIVISAKRPFGSNLLADIYMQAYDGECNSEKINGMLKIIKFGSLREPQYKGCLQSTIYLGQYLYNEKSFLTRDNLSQFQEYGIELNNNGIQFLYNDRVTYQANLGLTSKGEPMMVPKTNMTYPQPFGRPFNILFKIIARNDIKYQDAPVFEIDYIRVYGNDLDGSEIIVSGVDAHQKITKNNKISTGMSPFFIIGISLLVILIISLVVALVFALLRIKNIKIDITQTDNIYDDHFSVDNKDDEYEGHTYCEAYEVIREVNEINSNIRQNSYIEILNEETYI